MPPLILASSSVYRRQLLARLRLPFDWVAPGVDEAPLQKGPMPPLAGEGDLGADAAGAGEQATTRPFADLRALLDGSDKTKT